MSGYFVGYAKKSKGYRLYCSSHSIRFVESRNTKFLEHDLASRSDKFQNIISKRKQPSTSSEGLVII